MPIDDLTALGQKMREARKNKELTQQELSDLPWRLFARRHLHARLPDDVCRAD